MLIANLVSGTFKYAAHDGVKILALNMRFVGEVPKNCPKKSPKCAFLEL
jgi:hypothetical protein